jgi:hypothetical protein
MEDTPEFRLASLQRKFRLSQERQSTVTSIYATRYQSEVFDGRRVGAAFDTFLGYLRRGLTREDLWLAVLITPSNSHAIGAGDRCSGFGGRHSRRETKTRCGGYVAMIELRYRLRSSASSRF